ncbi:MAG: amino acid permease [Planctomycetes bacterium]|nr:amino acid permease [Planctomycetota bacterium]
MTVAYHAMLPIGEIAGIRGPNFVAASACERLLGRHGAAIASAAVMVSTFGALNSNLLVGPRVIFAMARDRLFLSPMARVHPRFRTPHVAILSETAWAIVLILAANLLGRVGHDVAVTATRDAPANGRLTRDLSMRLVINGDESQPISVTLAAAVTQGLAPDAPANQSLDDLVAALGTAIDKQLTEAKRPGAVRVDREGTKLKLDATSSGWKLQVGGAEQLGFAPDQQAWSVGWISSLPRAMALPVGRAVGGVRSKALFDVLTDFVIFGQFVFYLLAVAAVFVLRMRRPDLPRPYKTFGYPWLPLVFVLGSLGFLFGMLRTSPVESVVGLAFIGLGFIAYQFRPRELATRVVS